MGHDFLEACQGALGLVLLEKSDNHVHRNSRENHVRVHAVSQREADCGRNQENVRERARKLPHEEHEERRGRLLG